MSEEGGWQSLGNVCIEVIDTLCHTIQIKDRCESPIEYFLGAALAKLLHGTKASVRPQYWLGRFRYDLALMIEGVEKPVLLIECDSAAFHSDLEAIENDRRKDRAALAAGLPLIRFTGREINQRPNDCAKRALRYVFPGLP